MLRNPFIEVLFENSSCSQERFNKCIKYLKDSFKVSVQQNECFLDPNNKIECRIKNEETCFQRKKKFLCSVDSISADVYLVSEFESKTRRTDEKINVTIEKWSFDFSSCFRKCFGVSFDSSCSFSKIRKGQNISFWYELKFHTQEFDEKMKLCCERIFSIVNESSYPFCWKEKQELISFIESFSTNFDFFPLTEENFNSSSISILSHNPDQMYLVPKGKKCLVVFYNNWYWICKKEDEKWQGINKFYFSSSLQKLPFSNFICVSFEGRFLNSSSSSEILQQLFLGEIICLSSQKARIFYQRGELSIQILFGNLFSLIDKELQNSGFRTSWINFFSLSSNIVAEVEKLFFLCREETQLFKGICFSTKTKQFFSSFCSSAILSVSSIQDKTFSCVSKDFKTIHQVLLASENQSLSIGSSVKVFLSSSQNTSKNFIAGGVATKVFESPKQLSRIRKRNICFGEISEFLLLKIMCEQKRNQNLILCCSFKTQKDFCKLFSINVVEDYKSSLFFFEKKKNNLYVCDKTSFKKIKIQIRKNSEIPDFKYFQSIFFETPLSLCLSKFCFFDKK